MGEWSLYVADPDHSVTPVQRIRTMQQLRFAIRCDKSIVIGPFNGARTRFGLGAVDYNYGIVSRLLNRKTRPERSILKLPWLHSQSLATMNLLSMTALAILQQVNSIS